MAILFVAGFATLILWPNDLAYHSGYFLIGPGLILIGAFTAAAVGNAAPFNDRAFHRCLPPGDQSAFLRVIRLLLLVSAGIALTVLVYCLLFNFGWPSISFGLAAFILPLWAFAAAVGIITSIGSAGGAWRSAAWMAMLLAPLASSYAMNHWQSKSIYTQSIAYGEYYYLPPHRTVILLAAFAFPLIWWLVAVKRRKVLGLILGSLTSAVLPLMYYTGYFLPVGSFGEDWVSSRLPTTSLGLVRKPLPEQAQEWTPLADALEPTGLREGEFAKLQGLMIEDEKDGAAYRNGVILSDSHDRRESRPESIFVGKVGGQFRWGSEAVWEHLRGRIPAHQSFHYWTSAYEGPRVAGIYTRPFRILHPTSPHDPQMRPTDDPWMRPSGGMPTELDRATEDSRDDFTEFEHLKKGQWLAVLSGKIRWELAGECRAAEGGTFRLRHGVIKVQALKEGGTSLLSIQCYKGFSRDVTWEGPWFGTPDHYPPSCQPMVLLLDESGKDAYALDSLAPSQGEETTLGHHEDFTFVTPVPGSGNFLLAEPSELPSTLSLPNRSEPPGGREILRKGRLYVFIPVADENGRGLTLTAP